MMSTQDGPFDPDIWQAIPNSNAPTYDPGPLYYTTYFARCARREDCITFLETNITNYKSEYYLPGRINDLVHEGVMTVKMLETAFAWFGVTYKEDKPQTITRITELIDKGEYPPDIWNT